MERLLKRIKKLSPGETKTIIIMRLRSFNPITISSADVCTCSELFCYNKAIYFSWLSIQYETSSLHGKFFMASCINTGRSGPVSPTSEIRLFIVDSNKRCYQADSDKGLRNTPEPLSLGRWCQSILVVSFGVA